MLKQEAEVREVLVFDIWGDFAHFKKNYATTSALTYNFPPRNTIAGIIGAILGLKRAEFPEKLSPEKSYIGVSIRSPIMKKTITMNLIHTKPSESLIFKNNFGYFKKHTQIPFQFLSDISFRVYFSTDDEEIFSQLYTYLKNHKSHYTVSLGLSNLLCNFKFIEKRTITKKEVANREVEVLTVIPMNKVKEVNVFKNPKMNIENLPRFIDSSRTVHEYQEVLSSMDPEKPLFVVPGDALWEIENDKFISFL